MFIQNDLERGRIHIHNEDPLRLGIVGLGQAGTTMISAISNHPYIQITAAADLNQQNLTAFARDFHAETYTSLEELCQSDNVDAVYIATPTRFHAKQAMIAAQHRKHILVEKPMALTLQESDEVIQSLERNGVHMMVNHKRSQDPTIRKIREIVESGYLGKLGMINVWHFTDWIYRPRTPEELKDGGVVLRQGSHHFDMLRFIGGGQVKSVRAMTGVWDKNRNAEGSYLAYLQFENGIAATSVYSGYNHFNTDEFILGQRNLYPQRTEIPKWNEQPIHLNPPILNEEEEVKRKRSSGYAHSYQQKTSPKDKNLPFGLLIASCERGDIRVSEEGLIVYGNEENYEIPLLNQPSGLDIIITQFFNLIKKGKPTIYDARWGRACLEICHAVLESGKTGEEIFLKYQYSIDN